MLYIKSSTLNLSLGLDMPVPKTTLHYEQPVLDLKYSMNDFIEKFKSTQQFK